MDSNREYKDTSPIEIDEKKLVKAQAVVRGFFARKHYKIAQLTDAKSDQGETFVIGNDPKMPKELDNFAEPNEKIALIATSGMRAVSLACKLGNKIQTPKIFIVDVSQKVTTFWLKFRDFMQDDAQAGTQELFLQNLPQFLLKYKHLYRDFPADVYADLCTDKVQYLSQDIQGYFRALIRVYSFEYTRKVILHASIIRQTWEDGEVFSKLKNLINYLGITKVFMYPSNIIACTIRERMQMLVLENIQSLAPALAIHTDRCLGHGKPERVLLITDQKPSAVRSTLFASTCPVNVTPQQASLSIDLNLRLSDSISRDDIFEILQAAQRHVEARIAAAAATQSSSILNSKRKSC